MRKAKGKEPKATSETRGRANSDAPQQPARRPSPRRDRRASPLSVPGTAALLEDDMDDEVVTSIPRDAAHWDEALPPAGEASPSPSTAPPAAGAAPARQQRIAASILEWAGDNVVEGEGDASGPETGFLPVLDQQQHIRETMASWFGEDVQTPKGEPNALRITKVDPKSCIVRSGKRLSRFPWRMLAPHTDVLTKLVLSRNRLTNVPPQIGVLVGLAHLDLSHNALTGVADHIWRLPALTHLDMSHNRIHRIGPSVGDAGKLVSLNLCHNTLVSVSPRIAVVRSLQEVQLVPNPLGFPPRAICHWPWARVRKWTKAHETEPTLRFFTNVDAAGADLAQLPDELHYLDVQHHTTADEVRHDKAMEDYATSYIQLNPKLSHSLGGDRVFGASLAMFGVYDGHLGTRAAEFLVQHLHPRLIKAGVHLERRPKRIRAMTEAIFLQLDVDLCTLLRRDSALDGSTAVLIWLVGRRLVTAHVGDSRAVMASAGERWSELTVDHKPDQEAERARIEAAGGFVEKRGVWRANGILAMSRSFGDLRVKSGNPPPVVARPDVHVYELAPEDEWIVVASDGLWDVVYSDQVGRLLRTCDTAAEASEKLMSVALRRGTFDNTTVTVLKLAWGSHAKPRFAP